jgi:hypothetical protein
MYVIYNTAIPSGPLFKILSTVLPHELSFIPLRSFAEIRRSFAEISMDSKAAHQNEICKGANQCVIQLAGEAS